MTCIQTRKSQQTGAEISVIDNRDEGFSQGGDKWFTACDTHSMLCSHSTRALALSHAASPAGWCAGCAEVLRGSLWDKVRSVFAAARLYPDTFTDRARAQGVIEFANTVDNDRDIVMGEFFCVVKPAQVIWRTAGGSFRLQRECDDEWVVIIGAEVEEDVTSVRTVQQAIDAIMAAWKRLTPAPEAPEAPEAPTAVQGQQLRLF